MSVRQAQREIDSAEFIEWAAYHTSDPWGEERADLRIGILAATVVNMFSKKNYSASDFMPDFEGERLRPQITSPKLIENMMRTMFPRKQ